MSTSIPTLYIFAISHYCEKARWALDHLGIDYELRHVAPGEHMEIARKLGAARTSVPYLAVDGAVIQGSEQIVSWAERELAAADRSLTPDLESCTRIEQRIDEVAGVHVRRFYYSEAMVEYPATVRPVFLRGLRLSRKLMLWFAWGKIRNIMIARMDLGRSQGEESKNIVADELLWIDGLLADGREYLVGGTFSRADIAVASLLAPLALPAQHPVYHRMTHPPRMAQELSHWESRASMQWVRNMYAKHR